MRWWPPGGNRRRGTRSTGRWCPYRTTPRCSTGCSGRPAATRAGGPDPGRGHAWRSDGLRNAQVGEGEVELGDFRDLEAQLPGELLAQSLRLLGRAAHGVPALVDGRRHGTAALPVDEHADA